MSTAPTPRLADSGYRSAVNAQTVGQALLFICLSSVVAAVGAESALQAWTSIKDSGSCTAYRQFLSTYSDTPLASLARRELEACDREEAQALIDEWRGVKDRGSCAGFRDFLTRHPDAPTAAEARAEVDRCTAEEAKAAEAARVRAEAEEQARAQREIERQARRETENKAARERREAEQRAKQSARQAQQDLGCGNGFLSAARLATYFGNHTWEGWAGKLKWQEFYAPDGTMRGRAWKNGKRRPNYTGRWRLEGDRYCYCTADCLRYACRQVRQIGCENWTWDIDRNKKRSQVTKIYQGNPLGL